MRRGVSDDEVDAATVDCLIDEAIRSGRLDDLVAGGDLDDADDYEYDGLH